MEKKATAPTKERLTELINEYFLSKNYVITYDNRVYNVKLERFVGLIKKEKNKFTFYY